MINDFPTDVTSKFDFLPTSRWITLSLLLGFILTSACSESGPSGPPPTFDYAVELQVIDENDHPIPGVAVILDQKTIGYTDKEGLFRGVLREHPDVEVTLGAGDIQGYRFVTNQSRTEKLRVGRGLTDETHGMPVSHVATVSSTLNDYLAWISLKCEEPLKEEHCSGLPVRFNGELKTYTDRFGRAHFAFKGLEGEIARVEILTAGSNSDEESDSQSPKMIPHQAVYELELQHGAGIFLMEETFKAKEEASPARPQRRTTTKRSSRSKAPTKASAPSRPSTPKKVEKVEKKAAPEPAQRNQNVIDLW